MFCILASEYRSWLLYYSLPVLQGILPELYLTYCCLLVAAMYILLSDSIQLSSLRQAEEYLHKFYLMFAALCGRTTCIMPVLNNINNHAMSSTSRDDGCTMNLHLLKHLPECVYNWGPLWAYVFLFPFRVHEWVLEDVLPWY